MLQVANKELRHLRPQWVQSEAQLGKIAKRNGIVDLTKPIPVMQKIPTRLQLQQTATSAWERLGLSDSSPEGWRSLLRPEALMMNPQSRKRLCWSFMGMGLMLYDVVMIPMQFFELESGPFLLGMSWLSQLFWTLDIPLSFFTGVYVDSELEMRIHRIAYMYATSWLPIDLTITVSLWVVLALDSEADSAFKPIQYVRVLRFLRFARLMKFEALLNQVLERLNSPSLLVIIGIVKLIVLAVIGNHMIGCFWWGVGQIRYDDREGWGYGPLVAERSVLYQYLTAYHWALAQFQGSIDVMPGNTLSERLYSVATVLFALLAFAWFVSTLTNMLMQLEACSSERTRVNRVVQSFLGRHGVSAGLSMKVKGYVKWKQEQMKCYEYDEEVLSMLPHQLVMDIMEETLAPKVRTNRAFAHLHRSFPRTIRRLCKDALSNILPAPGQRIFGPNDECYRMYFVVSGQLSYVVKSILPRAGAKSSQAGDSFPRRSVVGRLASSAAAATHRRRTRLHDDADGGRRRAVAHGQQLSEAVLWVDWEYCGDLVAESNQVCLLSLETERFSEIIRIQPSAHASAVGYARRFAAGLNRFGKAYTDLIDGEELQELLAE